MAKYLKDMWQRMQQIFKPVSLQDSVVFDLSGYSDKLMIEPHLNGNGFLLAVPKHRRSLEKRLSRRFGWPEYHWKPLTSKTNLKLCKTCGHHYEFESICGNCYAKTKYETDILQKDMNFGSGFTPNLSAISQTAMNRLKIFCKEYKITESKKKDLKWFNQNLLESSTKK